MSEVEPENRGESPMTAGGTPQRLSAAQEQRLRWKIRVAAAAERRARASRQYGRSFDEACERVRDQLDASFWTRDEWGSSFDREDFARTVIALVDERPYSRSVDPRFVSAVLDSLEYTLTTHLAHRPGCPNWAVTRCATYHEDVVAADAVAAIFDVRAMTSRRSA